MTVSSDLLGRRVLVTRAAHQAQSFVTLLETRGATAITCPLIDIVPPESWQEIDQRLFRLKCYDDVILTSVNAVEMFFQRLTHCGINPAELDRLRWVCVGPKTAKVLKRHGRQPAIQPQEYRAEAVVEALLAQGVSGRTILYPRAELARDFIPSQLTAAEAHVDAPVLYRTLPAQASGEQIRQLLAGREVDVVTFSSSSSVENFVQLLGNEAAALTQSVVLASIGPLTTATAVKLGLTVAVEAAEYTLEGLVQALIDYFNPSGQAG